MKPKQPKRTSSTLTVAKSGKSPQIQIVSGVKKLEELEYIVRNHEAKGFHLQRLGRKRSGRKANEFVFTKLASGSKKVPVVKLSCTSAPADAVVTHSSDLFVEGDIQTVKVWRVKTTDRV